MDKPDFRKMVQSRLRETAAQHHEWRQRICTYLDESLNFRKRLLHQNVMVYLGLEDEVFTMDVFWYYWHNLKSDTSQKASMIVPFCHGDDLQAWRIENADELVPGRFGILEPTVAVRADETRHILPEMLDWVLVPGVAFDIIDGNRLGRGKGFYDRFLAKLRPDAISVGLAFLCQIFPKIPTEPHDQRVSAVVTERSGTFLSSAAVDAWCNSCAPNLFT